MGRVLVLIQAPRFARRTSTRPIKQNRFAKTKIESTTDASFALSRLQNIRINRRLCFRFFSFFTDGIAVSICFPHLCDYFGADLPYIYAFIKTRKIIKKQEFLFFHTYPAHYIIFQNIGYEILR